MLIEKFEGAGSHEKLNGILVFSLDWLKLEDR